MLACIIPLMFITCVAFLSLNVRYYRAQQKQTYSKEVLPLSKCCCLSYHLTVLLTKMGVLVKRHETCPDSEESERLQEASSQPRRDTICKVNLDVQPPAPEPNTWGTANQQLFTDVITVTPKSSPDVYRKIRLPKNSPLLHHKSQDNMQRPEYKKSFSADSGCISDIDGSNEKDISAVSMGSLMSVLMKFSGGKQTKEEKAQQCDLRPKPPQPNKPVPLSRLVLDPHSSKRHSRPECDSSGCSRPIFNRSISSDDRPAKFKLAPPKLKDSANIFSSKEKMGSTSAINLSNNSGSQMNKITTKKPMMPPNSKPNLIHDGFSSCETLKNPIENKIGNRSTATSSNNSLNENKKSKEIQINKSQSSLDQVRNNLKSIAHIHTKHMPDSSSLSDCSRNSPSPSPLTQKVAMTIPQIREPTSNHSKGNANRKPAKKPMIPPAAAKTHTEPALQLPGNTSAFLRKSLVSETADLDDRRCNKMTGFNTVTPANIPARAMTAAGSNEDMPRKAARRQKKAMMPPV